MLRVYVLLVQRVLIIDPDNLEIMGKWVMTISYIFLHGPGNIKIDDLCCLVSLEGHWLLFNRLGPMACFPNTEQANMCVVWGGYPAGLGAHLPLREGLTDEARSVLYCPKQG